jgi:hypothetical protein
MFTHTVFHNRKIWIAALIVFCLALAPAAATAVTINLSDHENIGGSHTLSRHVGKTDRQLAERLIKESNISASSSFASKSKANAAVSKAVTDNWALVQRMLTRHKKGMPEIHASAGSVGRGVTRKDFDAALKKCHKENAKKYKTDKGRLKKANAAYKTTRKKFKAASKKLAEAEKALKAAKKSGNEAEIKGKNKWVEDAKEKLEQATKERDGKKKWALAAKKRMKETKDMCDKITIAEKQVKKMTNIVVIVRSDGDGVQWNVLTAYPEE